MKCGSCFAKQTTMRVVIDGRYLCGRSSGIGRYVRALVTRLPNLAPEVDFRIWTGPDWSDAQLPLRAELHPIRSSTNGLMSLFGLRWLDHLAPNDLFHSTANILGFGLPCRSVVTVHDTMWLDRIRECQPNWCLRPISFAYFRTGIKRALRSADRIVTVSHASARAIESVDKHASNKLRVIHHGVEPCFRPPQRPAKARRDAASILGFDGEYLLVVGQNQPSKGHDIVLQAFASLRASATRLVFVQRLSGGLRLREQVRAAGLADRVRFVAELETEAFVPVMQSALVFLQPSFGEGFGLPALEAMACGCPVLASDIEVLREVLADAAGYAAAGDAGDWLRAIDNIVSNRELRASLGQRGHRRAQAFSWDNAARATLGVYREIMAETARTRFS